MRGVLAGLTVAVLCLTACGKGNFFASTPVASAGQGAPVSGYALYHAYGDSITAGVGVANQSFVYAALAAAYNSIPFADYALGGDEACDVPTRQIFPANDQPSLAIPGLYSLLIGTNDVDVRGTGAGEATYTLCHQAAVSWLATPLETRVLATSSTVTVQGVSHLDTQNNFNAVTTDALGASITFPFTRAFASPLYLWYRIEDYNPGAFTCSLDGATVAALQTAPSPPIQTPNGSGFSVGVYRLPSVAAGTHALRCTQTGAGTSGMALLGIGWPPAVGTRSRPRLLVGLLPLQAYGDHASTLAAYDADIRGTVALFAGDGLDVVLFDAAAYMTGTSADMADSLHPNAVGQQEIFRAFQQALR